MADMAKLTEAMGELDESIVTDIINEVMAVGGSEAQSAMEACQKGMDIIGERFATGEYFVSDLVYAGEIMTDVVEQMSSALAGDSMGGPTSKLIIATVAGDLHDIGKNIVKAFLKAAGFEVIDLGTDVAPGKIVDTAKSENAKIIALSGILTLALDSMKDTVEACKSEGIRNDVKIIIGGNPVSDKACETIGADAWAQNPQKAVEICKNWVAD